jgi:hypothetical protein
MDLVTTTITASLGLVILYLILRHAREFGNILRAGYGVVFDAVKTVQTGGY